jgi:hypothetical protein
MKTNGVPHPRGDYELGDEPEKSAEQELIDYLLDGFWLLWDEPWFRRLENSYAVVKNGELVGHLHQRQILIKGLVVWHRGWVTQANSY